MLGAIYIGLSGMNAYSKGLQTISNNVANLNSPGFKSTSVSFSDVFNHGGAGLSYLGGMSSYQSGNGVRFGEQHVNFRQGDLRQTEGDLDLAIQGSGFMVLLNNGKTYYARTGTFAVADDGYIVMEGTENRLAVLDGEGRAVALNIDAKRTSAPKATTTITFADNLSSTATEAKVSDINVYDDRGGKQVWQVKFTPVGATSPNTWDVTVTDQTGAELKKTQLKFIGSIVDPSTAKITVDTAPAGASALSVVLDFSSGVTSFSSGTSSSLRASDVDGNAVGALTTVTVDEDGKIKLAYSNSESELLGSVALADFRDPQQLDRVGNGLFENKSGTQMRLLASEQDGVGKLLAKQFEASNVDLSQEFGDLILIQRGFQASSQVVSVSNDMIQQLFGIRGQG